jgi:hypothetical protein
MRLQRDASAPQPTDLTSIVEIHQTVNQILKTWYSVLESVVNEQQP